MKTRWLLKIIILYFFLVGFNFGQDKNIINYFANNNQIIGVPYIDKINEFRFYPDVSFQEAITHAEVYYYIKNDVYQSDLIKRENGLYWGCLIDRKFDLGESIQRVEVIVECDKFGLNSILHDYDIKTENEDLYNYLLLRRGDDRSLFAKSIYQNQLEIIDNLNETKQQIENSRVLIDSLRSIKEIIEKGELKKGISNLKDTINNYNKAFGLSMHKAVPLDIVKVRINELKDSQKRILFKDIVRDSLSEKTIKDFIKNEHNQSYFSGSNNFNIPIMNNSSINELSNELLNLFKEDTVLTLENFHNMIGKKITQQSIIEKRSLDLEPYDTVVIDSNLKKFTALFADGEKTINILSTKELEEVSFKENDFLMESKVLSDNVFSIDKWIKAKSDSIDYKFNQLISKLSYFTELKNKIDLQMQNQNEIVNKIDKISFLSKSDIIQQTNGDNKLYNAYIENRASSLLDIKYKPNNRDKLLFTYRNDKPSLQYLQAADPVEDLGIFRVRLVPFAIYGESSTPDIKWRSNRVIYEFALNFGHGIIKDDNFQPVLFDINRLGLAIGIAADTFSEKKEPKEGEPIKDRFLSIGLSYDVNTYSSITFGINIFDAINFYMGVGINKRAFEDLVKAAGGLF